MKAIMKVCKVNNEWTVNLSIGHQSFNLHPIDTKMHAEWTERMLDKALKNLNEN